MFSLRAATTTTIYPFGLSTQYFVGFLIPLLFSGWMSFSDQTFIIENIYIYLVSFLYFLYFGVFHGGYHYHPGLVYLLNISHPAVVAATCINNRESSQRVIHS